MMGKIVSGTELAEGVKRGVFDRVQAFYEKYGRRPGLGVILVGDDPASARYVRAKNGDCAACDISCVTETMPGDIPESRLHAAIVGMNENPEIDGVLVQMPLPAGFDSNAVKSMIDPMKDVDCFTPVNAGRLWTNNESVLVPCTPAGVMEMIKASVGLDWCAGKSAVVIGRSNIVGRPMAEMLLAADMTVTICHSKTPVFWKYTKSADLVVTAAGRPGLLRSEDIKFGAVVIDVSMNRDENGKLCGDCDKSVEFWTSYITPVPGGVGPMTRAMLMRNVITAAENIEAAKRRG